MINIYRKAIHNTIAPTVSYKDLRSDDEMLPILSRDETSMSAHNKSSLLAQLQGITKNAALQTLRKKCSDTNSRELRMYHVMARHCTLFWESDFSLYHHCQSSLFPAIFWLMDTIEHFSNETTTR